MSEFFNSADFTRDVDVPESTVYGQDDRTYIAGLRGGTISYAGFWDSTVVTGVDVVLEATLGVATARIITHAPAGLAIGNIVYMFSTHSTSYAVSHPVDGIVSLTSDVQATGIIDRGVSLHSLTAETAVADFASVDNAASSANGGIGFLHVTIFTGTNATFVISDDADDVNPFSDIITFTVVTGPTSESATAAGTIERYVRSEISAATALTTTTFSISFARR
jgi:hypothetical protein